MHLSWNKQTRIRSQAWFTNLKSQTRIETLYVTNTHNSIKQTRGIVWCSRRVVYIGAQWTGFNKSTKRQTNQFRILMFWTRYLCGKKRNSLSNIYDFPLDCTYACGFRARLDDLPSFIICESMYAVIFDLMICNTINIAHSFCSAQYNTKPIRIEIRLCVDRNEFEIAKQTTACDSSTHTHTFIVNHTWVWLKWNSQISFYVAMLLSVSGINIVSLSFRLPPLLLSLAFNFFLCLHDRV